MYSAGIVVALTAIGLRNATIDKLAIRLLVARFGQTEKHIAFAPTTPAASASRPSSRRFLSSR